MTCAMEVRDLHVSYGATTALTGVDLDIHNSEVVALVGANGAGKSTLLNAILGLVPSRSGAIQFEGTSIGNLSIRQRIVRGLALSPEGRQVFAELTVLENLDLGYMGRDPKLRNDRVDRIFSMFPRLSERQRQLAGTLSGGEQQMLAIGRALMAGPKLLMLDEPTLGLAPIIVLEIEKIIAKVRSQGVAVLLAEQNASMALSVSDRAYVLQGGKVVLAGSASEVSANDQVRSAYLGL